MINKPSILQLHSDLSAIRFSSQEHLLCWYFSKNSQLIQKKILQSNSPRICEVKLSSLFGPLKKGNVHSLLLAHNHPSGIVYPSRADILATKKIESLCFERQIILNDHLIVTPNQLYSMKQNSDY